MGSQFADDSMTPKPLTVTRDKYENEIATDKPMHDNSTPGEGAWAWSEGHYAKVMSYGVDVSAPEGVDKLTVDNSRADRGRES